MVASYVSTLYITVRVVTELALLEQFYEAEAEHKEYYLRNQANMYCQLVISPKVEKVREKFAGHTR